MPSFILRHLDPEFWSRVQTKAKAEGVPIKALILRLLASWLATVLLMGVVGCASQLPTQPDAVTPAVQTTPASIRLTLATRPDRTYDVTATVLTADGHFVKDVPLTFAMESGSVTPETAMTNVNGMAQAIASASSSTTLTVSGASVTASTHVEGVPGPTAPPPPTPPPPPPPVGTIQLQPVTTTVGVSTLLTVGVYMGSQPIASEAWAFGDGGTTQTASTAVTHTYLTAGTFTASVTATDTLGRRASSSALVTVQPAPIPTPPPTTPPPVLSASLTCTPATHPAPSACNVVASYDGNALPSGRISKVDWDWGDGLADLAAGPSMAHPYLLPGIYTVFATVTLTTATPDGRTIATTSKAIAIP